MKLWVDDIRNAPDDSWSVARSVDSAISFISQFGDQVTEISLDHDISHQVGMGELSRPYPCVETFTAVARYIAEKWWRNRDVPEMTGIGVARTLACPKITVHSSNPMGAANIKFILDASGIPSTYKPVGIANRLEQEIK